MLAKNSWRRTLRLPPAMNVADLNSAAGAAIAKYVASQNLNAQNLAISYDGSSRRMLTDPNMVYPGQQLRIPSKTEGIFKWVSWIKTDANPGGTPTGDAFGHFDTVKILGVAAPRCRHVTHMGQQRV